MVRGIAVGFVLVLCLIGCKQDGNESPDKPQTVVADFDGLSQDCFDCSVRVRSRNSIGSASAIAYLKQVGNQRSTVDSILDATHVEFETNKHVAGTRGTKHVLDVWFEGDLVSSVDCTTDDSWYESGIAKDIATIIVPVETLGGAMPIVKPAPYGEANISVDSKVFMVGCSDGRHPRARCGTVLKIENGLIYYLPQSIGGDSGSAVFAYSKEREEWNVVGRTAWAIQIDGRWVGLAMTSDRVADIRSGSVSAGDFKLPTGAVPISKMNLALPAGAIPCDQIKETNAKQDQDPQPLEVVNRRRWRFPIQREDIRTKPERPSRMRDWSILGGVADFIRSLIRFAFATAIVLLLVGLYIAPTILTPLKYDWPIVAVKQLLALFRKK